VSPPSASVAEKPSPAPPLAGAKTADTTPAREKSSSVPFSQDDFKNDPLIQKALEVFKGTIVQVRA
jgi:hypothetical protein